MTKLGAITFPVEVPAPHYDQSGKLLKEPEALGDPALTRLGDFFQAVINAEFATAWHSLYRNTLPVERAFTHDPNKVVFNTRDLPALFLHRTAGYKREILAEDYILATSRIRVLWVYPARAQEDRKSQQPSANAVAAVMLHFNEIGRHPAYRWSEDTDPTSVTQGTPVLRATGFEWIIWIGYKIVNVEIGMASDASRDRDGDRGHYEALEVQLDIQELDILDLEAFPLLQGVDLTITTSDKARDLAVAKLR